MNGLVFMVIDQLQNSIVVVVVIGLVRKGHVIEREPRRDEKMITCLKCIPETIKECQSKIGHDKATIDFIKTENSPYGFHPKCCICEKREAKFVMWGTR